MPIEILMPALSPTMTEGTLAKWLKQEGDAVEPGDAIAEIETDKATMEVEAVEEGRLGKILVPSGTEGVAVNTAIALLLAEGEDAASLEGYRPGGGSSEAAAAPPPATADATPVDVPKAPAPAAAGSSGRVFASPLARRLAQQAGLDIAAIAGSGPHGRIVKRDIETALAAGPAKQAATAKAPAAATPAAKPAGPPAAAAGPIASGPSAKDLADAFGIPYRSEKPNGMRKTIARRLLEAKQTIPHWYLTVDCELDALLKLRQDLNARSGDGVKLSVNDLVIKAAAIALRRVPQVNTAWTDDEVLYFERVDVSVAVATDNGLITPIVKDADRKGLAEISAEMRDLGKRAKENKLKPEEYQGGTFTISNLGMFGAREFAAIINPPQAAIVALGAGEPRPVVKDGALAIATVMSATLSADHRIVDGAVSAQYMSVFKKIVEDPLTMLL